MVSDVNTSKNNEKRRPQLRKRKKNGEFCLFQLIELSSSHHQLSSSLSIQTLLLSLLKLVYALGFNELGVLKEFGVFCIFLVLFLLLAVFV